MNVLHFEKYTGNLKKSMITLNLKNQRSNLFLRIFIYLLYNI